MKIFSILSFYIGRCFLVSFFTVFVVFLGIIFLFDTIELLRRASSHENVGIALVFKMALYKLPFLAQQALPFAVLFGGMGAFWKLTRSSELVVARAAGVSAWQFLFPVLVIALFLGILKITAFNPLASALLAKFDRLNEIHLKGKSSLLALSPTGLWLRQANDKNQSVIHAKKISLNSENIDLSGVTIFVYEGADKYRQRIDAKTAILEDGFWHLKQVEINSRNQELPTKLKEHWVATDINLNNIHDSFAPPETMSFWDLPDFIANLDRAGFSALRHRLYWHQLMSGPLLLFAMILIAATFTLRHSNRGSATFVIVGGILTGFLLFFFSDVVFALGLRGSIPIILAAWTPSGVSTLLGLAMVFHLEDG